jgi:hypothetical protein
VRRFSRGEAVHIYVWLRVAVTLVGKGDIDIYRVSRDLISRMNSAVHWRRAPVVKVVFASFSVSGGGKIREITILASNETG